MLCLQILLGGLTSANFAASACQSLPDCHGMWLPGAELWSAFDLSRSLQITEQGFVIGGAERADIHILHRIVALFTVVVGIDRRRAGNTRRWAGFARSVYSCALVVSAEFLIGVVAIRSGVPIGIAVSHNWLAGLLLLGLLRLRADA